MSICLANCSFPFFSLYNGIHMELPVINIIINMKDVPITTYFTNLLNLCLHARGSQPIAL